MKIQFINFLIFFFIFITFLTTFSSLSFAQQISIGFEYGFIPFPYSSSFTSIKNNTYYSAFLSFSFNISKNYSLSFLLERSTFNIMQPNSFSVSFSYFNNFLRFNEKIKVLFSDSISNFFPYFENYISALFDFYPVLFIFFSIKNPFYIQPIFSSIIDLPKSDTFENYDINSEFGFYIYQLSIGLSFEYSEIHYNFDSSNTPIVYNKIIDYDIALQAKYLPTFTLFGFALKLGYSYNQLITTNNSSYLHQYFYAKAGLVFNFSNIRIEPSAAFLIYSIVSSNITDLSSMYRFYFALSAVYLF